jgi:hypothetical protein
VTWKPDYCTLPELKSYLRIDDTNDDVFLAVWITTVSRNIVDLPESRSYPTAYDRHLGCWVAQIDDVMDVDELDVIDANARVVTDCELWPINAAAEGEPYTQIMVNQPGRLVISAPWGPLPGTAGPTAAKAAVWLQAARLAARRDSPFGIAGSPSEGGSEIRLLAKLDPDVITCLNPVRRQWWAS